MLFSKIDKKILIWLVIASVVILLLGLAIYRYTKEKGVKVQDSIGGIGTEAQQGGGTLTVCVDKCGDGICQKTDPNCDVNNNLNCPCPETLQECPQDCK